MDAGTSTTSGTTHVAPATRVRELDGIRGWAALSVVAFHLFWEVLGPVVPAIRSGIVVSGLMNGGMAVTIFFILSGDALSTPILRTNSTRMIARLAVARYPRLTLPVFFSCLLAYLLLVSGLTFNKPAATVIEGNAWLAGILDVQPSFGGLVRYSLWSVYFHPAEAGRYNPMLWTMPTELMGSFLTFLFLLVRRHIEHFELVLLLMILLATLVDTFLVAFPIGILLAQRRLDGRFAAVQDSVVGRWLCPSGFAGLILASGWLQSLGYFSVIVYSYMASAMLLCIHGNAALCRFFAENTVSQFLGRISFPLYLTHLAVIVSLYSHLILVTGQHQPPDTATLLAAASGCMAACILVAVAFIPIEALTHKVGKALARCLP